MEDVYLKDLKAYSTSKTIDFREKYLELMEKNDAEDSKEKNNLNSELKMSTIEKLKRMRKNMGTTARKKCKGSRKEMPALLPQYIPEDNSESEIDLVPGTHAAFIFRVYPPFRYDANQRGRKPIHNMEIAILGHQTLNLLCDQIACHESYMEIGGDVSHDPDTPTRTRLGEKYKSRMLYIGNSFYVDRSREDNKDYSEAIRRWGRKENLNFGPTFDMHEKTCLDLVARIGFPYVYQHLGACEHVIMIEYARLLEPKDCLESKYYPFYFYLTRSSSRPCMACMEISHWIVFDSPRMISNPSFLCNTCFRSYHYIDGKKVGTFSAIRYWDSPVFAEMFDDICKSQTRSETE